MKSLLLSLVLLASTQPVFASFTQEFSGRNEVEIEKKARENGFAYPANQIKCNGMMCWQKWVKK
jgi:hypothetical protein